MVDYREILRLDKENYSQRQIEASTGISRHTMSDVLAAAKAAGIEWPLGEEVTNEDLRSILFPGKFLSQSEYLEPDYAMIHKELAKPGVTLTLLWNEYCRHCAEVGKRPYMSTQFGDKYRKWAKVTKATMRIQHKPGDVMEVDWAGNTLTIWDSMTGESSPAYLFVAVLPCSGYAYVEACSDMKLENWLMCHVHAYAYFGGVTRLLIPDNLKTGVTKNTRYETVLNRSYQELAEHYDTAVVPARVEHPRDKSHAEGTVRLASTWILAALRNEHFFSLSEAQEAVKEKLEEMNQKPFQAPKTGCRRSVYLEEERDFMKPLPAVPYELSTWMPNMSVSTDYLISDGRNKYSVPFDLIGEKVDVRLTRKTVEVFYHGNRIWVMGSFGNGRVLCPVDREILSFGDPLPLSALPDGANELFFGPGHDFYYRSGNFLYAADFEGSGVTAISDELILDFMNSDLSRDSASILAVYGPEAVLISDRGENAAVPSIYRKAPDVDLSAVTVLRLVHTGQPEISLAGKITSFNKSHDGVRIVVDSYQSKEDYLGGEKQLAAEMATGARPDIVVTSQSGPALSYIVKRGLFADLNPFAEREGLLNRDNIMGCVKRTFTDGDGRLFGLTPSFWIQTVVSTDELLGKYAGRDSWTAEELLDFAESLSSDRLLMEGLTRNSAAYMLLGPGGYACFLSEDGKTASFDSDLFIRYLHFIASLPSREEYDANPPLEGLNADASERYQLYHEGKIVLKQKVLTEPASFLGMELDFGTKDWRLIGQPTNVDCGTAISADSVYLITAADSERAELAWEVLETLFEPDAISGAQGIPGLVSEFERVVREYYAYDFAFTFSGTSSRDLKNSWFPLTLAEPGILTEFTEEDERRIRDILDNHCGIPFALSANEDVTAIVNEEISVFLGGVGTAEDCAKKIQSRVSIMLAERG